jgi:hypothetical protein
MTVMNLKKLVEWSDWGGSVSLIANSGVQILDFEFNLDVIKKHRIHFSEKIIDTETLSDDYRKLEVLPDNDDVGHSNQSENDQSVSYEITAVKALEPFLDNWIPIPFFRTSDSGPEGSCDIGPTTWSRMRVSKKAIKNTSTEDSPFFRVQIAIDTTVNGADDDYTYLQPNEKDTCDRSEFRFVSEVYIVDQFLTTGTGNGSLSTINSHDEPMWVTEWIMSLFKRFLKKTGDKGRPIHRKVSENSTLEHWSRYIALLQVVDRALFIPRLKLLSSPYLDEETHAIDVDLILDIGNSRTCGLLIEQSSETVSVDLSGAVPLALRDLSDPQYSYEGLFQSRVEFADHNFGEARLARACGRNNAFIWPSFVRFGPEAMRLVQSEQGNETVSGLSSPKRYLWDTKPMQQDWRFHHHKDPRRPPTSLSAALVNLTVEGDHKKQIEEDVKNKLRLKSKLSRAKKARFSRASLYGFMVAEIIAHAFVQINDASYRIKKPQKDLPRRLRRVILTLPTATPSQEQAIVKSKVSGALKMVWDRMVHWGNVSHSNQPDLLIDWDEASCTQVMFLYSEIMAKYEGRMSQYLQIFGKKRVTTNNEEKQSVKIACIDIGGGTTDLMVTTFSQEDEVSLVPNQEFREGFRIAGDDLLSEVISSVVLPKLKASITGVSMSEIDAKFKNLFGMNVASISEPQKQVRRQFGLRVLTPIALAVLEKSLQCLPEMEISVTQVFRSESNEHPPESMINFLQGEVRKLGEPNWSLLDQNLHFSHEEIEQIFERLFGLLISNISEVVYQLNVDLVLLTGRPSKHPIVRQMLVDSCIAPPNRVIAMHDYQAGSWYPFRNNENKVGDPKGTVVVGAMLIALSDRNIRNFHIPLSEFKMKTTSKYIGKMEISGQITNQNVYFGPDDGDDEAETTIKMVSPLFIGSRQLNIARWKTSQLYLLEFVKEPGIRPYEVTIKRRAFESYEDDEYTLASEAIKESLIITEVLDAEGRSVHKDDLRLSLQTLGHDGNYWLDTGCFIP